jgi:hypothetical protein
MVMPTTIVMFVAPILCTRLSLCVLHPASITMKTMELPQRLTRPAHRSSTNQSELRALSYPRPNAAASVNTAEA